MSILGVESVVFAVDDLATCARFWEDFGLRKVSADGREAVFDVPSGSRVIVRNHGDPRSPKPVFDGNGVILTVWGVETAEALESYVERLESAVAVTREKDGTAVFQAPDGQWVGLRVWDKKPVVSVASPVNTPSSYPRFNQHRIWRKRAIPKTINHVVFYTPDYVGSYEFYRDYLDFRYTDHSKGVGIFARADGTHEHHSMFWVNCDLPIAPDDHGFMHIAFGMDDIDEVMLGANLMEARGWKNTSMNSSGGISRHRITSAIYYYVDNPCGGEAEYHADTDYLDDNWVPRAWDFKFGSLLWSHNAPAIFRGEDIPWDMSFDADESSFDPYRKKPGGKSKGEVPEVTEAEEHAV